MLNKRVSDLIESLPPDHRGAVKLHPLIARASRGVSLKDLYDLNRREHAVLAAAFKAAEMIVNDSAACDHVWSPVNKGVTDFYFGTYPKYTRYCTCCPYIEEYIATKKPDINELTSPIPDWVIATFTDRVPAWAL